MTITAEQAAKLLVTGSANYCGNDLARALITSEAVKTLAAAKPGGLFTDQDEDICIDDGRANNLVFCPARDDSEIEGGWPVLNPDVVAEIVARYNIAPDLARDLIASEAARKLAEERLARAVEGLSALDRAAGEVARQGAVTGPQWTRLSVALLKARAILKEIGDD